MQNSIYCENALPKENQIIYNEFEKVYNEYIELSIKVYNLTQFIISKKFDEINDFQKKILPIQLENMQDYLSNLKARLIDFLETMFKNCI